MDDLISRASIEWHNFLVDDGNGMYHDEKVAYKSQIDMLPSAQPEPLTVTRDHLLTKDECDRLKQTMRETPILLFPPAQPTLYGYNIEHLDLIARVLQKENLPPDRVTEILTDIGRIVAIVIDEFEESLRKAVEQCVT